MPWYEWIFSGIGATFVALLFGVLVKRKRAGRLSRVKQSQRAGDNANQTQAGRDVSKDSK